MAMSADERKVVSDGLDALGAISLVVGAALKVLNNEVPSFRRRLLESLAVTASASAQRSSFLTNLDTKRLLAMATQFISLLEDRDPPQ